MPHVGAKAERLPLILAQLNAVIAPGDMGLPGLGLHPLKGDRKGTWAVKVSGNWRVTFTFVGTTPKIQNASDPTGTIGYDAVGNETQVGPGSANT